MAAAIDEASWKTLGADLARAQRDKNQTEVDRIAAQCVRMLGERAGLPETPDEFRAFKPGAVAPGIDVSHAFDAYLARLKDPKEQWWLGRPAPTRIPAPLRYVAGVIAGALAARRAGCAQGERLLELARGAAEYLLWAQAQGGRGVFPVPDLRGKGGRIPELSERFLARAERDGVLEQVLVNGWLVDDLGGGDLQFDNGLCGAAMLEMRAAGGDEKYLRAARAAADWAAARPAVPNWNYNSFTVYLLAETFRATGEARYLDAAREKARLGVLPGQLTAGPRAGRWADPHNARLVYHFIICRGLGALLSVLPAGDPDLPRVRQALERALSAATGEIARRGIANPETTLEVLARLAIWFPPGSPRLADAGRGAALELLTRYAAEGLARGRLAVPPNAWGLCLEAREKGKI